jgi:Ni/Co efflux regulator RcnB
MLRVAMLIIVALAVSMPVQAKPQKDKSHKTSRDVMKEQSDVEMRAAFSPAERNLIRSQLFNQKRATSKKRHKDLPPGLQKKVARGKALPPGWQKKLAPGQNLDYQTYRLGEGLPEDLLLRLPPPPDGSEILQIEDTIVLLNTTTRTILDIFDLTPTR